MLYLREHASPTHTIMYGLSFCNLNGRVPAGTLRLPGAELKSFQIQLELHHRVIQLFVEAAYLGQ